MVLWEWYILYFMLRKTCQQRLDPTEVVKMPGLTQGKHNKIHTKTINWAPSSEFVSSSIPSLQILTAQAQPFREARDLAFCLKVPLDSLLVWASSGGSGETARMCRLAWTFATRIGDKYKIRLTRSNWKSGPLAFCKLRKYQAFEAEYEYTASRCTD